MKDLNMNYNYRYQLKNKSYRKTVMLNDSAHRGVIENAIKNTFGVDLLKFRVEKSFFEFQLVRLAKKSELHDLGKRIAANDEFLNSIKQKYPNSTQLFIRMPNRYYGYLEGVIQNDEENFLLLFDSAYYGDLDFLDSNENEVSKIEEFRTKTEFLRELNSFTVEVQISKQNITNYMSISLKKELETNGFINLYDWYSYEEAEGGTLAFSYPFRSKYVGESEDIREPLNVSKVKRISKGYLINNLRNYFSLGSLDVVDRGHSILKNLMALQESEDERKASFIAIYDVGQALCCAVCDDNGCPLIYFDFGAPFGRNAKTYPNKIDFCFGNNPPIILSHWDKDHWYGAMKHIDAQEQKWVVPNQKIGIQATQFAYLLWEKNNLIIWDDSLAYVSTFSGIVFKCEGPHTDIHNYGIGMLASTTNIDEDKKHYLLPGDNNYKYINISYVSKLLHLNDGMVATHHGGEYCEKLPMVSSDIPPSAKEGKIVYSYGDGNSHGHPLYTLDHSSRGWNRSLETKLGDCALGLASSKVSSSCPICKNKRYNI